MTRWPEDELRKIAAADDLHIAPFLEDGTTYGTSTWIWSVAVDDALYVRAYNWTGFPMVPSGGPREEGSRLRAYSWTDQRSRR